MQEIMTTIVTSVLISFFGSAGIIGLFFRKVTRCLDEKETEARDTASKREKELEKRYILNNDFQHATGRTFFWLVKGCYRLDKSHEYWNGELEKSFDKMEKIEMEIKKLDNEQLARVNTDG